MWFSINFFFVVVLLVIRIKRNHLGRGQRHKQLLLLLTVIIKWFMYEIETDILYMVYGKRGKVVSFTRFNATGHRGLQISAIVLTLSFGGECH